MAHVADRPLPDPSVAMPPHAWPADRQRPNPHILPPASTPAHTPWHSLASDAHHPIPSSASASTDLHRHLDRRDLLDADSVFRDLLNMGIADDDRPDSVVHPDHHLAQPADRLAPHPALSVALAHSESFLRAPDHDRLAAHDQRDQAEQALKRYTSQLNPLPVLDHHPQLHPQESPVQADLAHHDFSSLHMQQASLSSAPPLQRRHSAHPSLYTAASSLPTVPDRVSRASTPAPTRAQGGTAASHAGPRIKNDLYKTEICRSFAENNGFCKYGSKCQFAHGEHELRPVRRHPRYKTKLCRNFVNTGSCPYDTRCRFIHANDLPFVSAASLAQVHQGASSTHSGRMAEPSHFDNSADHLRQIFNLAQSSPSAAVNSTHGSNPAATVEGGGGISPIDASRGLRTDSSVLGERSGKAANTVLPADQVYHANANVFQEYPDSGYGQSFIPLVWTEGDQSFQSSAFTESDVTGVGHSLGAQSAVDRDDLAARFSPTNDSRRNGVFGSDSKKVASKSNPRSVAMHSLGLQTEIGSKGNVTNIVSSSATRSRLPVFRNMATDGDADSA